MTTMAVSPSSVFDIWAQVYDEQPNPLLALEQRFLSRMLPDVSGLDVLDAGCGTGRWLQVLASHRPASLVGVDASPEMLRRACAKLGAKSTLRLGGCTALPAQSATADLILASFILSYLDSLDIFARELHRVARPGAAPSTMTSISRPTRSRFFAREISACTSINSARRRRLTRSGTWSTSSYAAVFSSRE